MLSLPIRLPIPALGDEKRVQGSVTPPQGLPDVWQTKDFKSNENGSVATKGVKAELPVKEGNDHAGPGGPDARV